MTRKEAIDLAKCVLAEIHSAEEGTPCGVRAIVNGPAVEIIAEMLLVVYDDAYAESYAKGERNGYAAGYKEGEHAGASNPYC